MGREWTDAPRAAEKPAARNPLLLRSRNRTGQGHQRWRGREQPLLVPDPECWTTADPEPAAAGGALLTRSTTEDVSAALSGRFSFSANPGSPRRHTSRFDCPMAKSW